MRRSLPGTIGVVAWSTAVWVALWSTLSLANVLWGIVVGLFVLRLAPTRPPSAQHGFRPVAFLGLLIRFLGALVEASAIVAWEVVTPRNRINEAIVRVPLRTDSAGLVTAIANAITLTPGTLTLEVHTDPAVLYVHVLHLRTIEQVRQSIRDLEDQFLAAFPPLPATADAEDRPWTR